MEWLRQLLYGDLSTNPTESSNTQSTLQSSVTASYINRLLEWPSYKTVGLLDYLDVYFKGCDIDQLNRLAAIGLWLRDPVRGRNQISISRVIFGWLQLHGYEKHIKYIPIYGTWKDLLYLPSPPYKMLADKLEQGDTSVAYDMPSERSVGHEHVKMLCKELKCNFETYRKKYTSPLRRQHVVVVKEKLEKIDNIEDIMIHYVLQ